jgi:hypothetical protein
LRVLDLLYLAREDEWYSGVQINRKSKKEKRARTPFGGGGEWYRSQDGGKH